MSDRIRRLQLRLTDSDDNDEGEAADNDRRRLSSSSSTHHRHNLHTNNNGPSQQLLSTTAAAAVDIGIDDHSEQKQQHQEQQHISSSSTSLLASSDHPHSHQHPHPHPHQPQPHSGDPSPSCTTSTLPPSSSSLHNYHNHNHHHHPPHMMVPHGGGGNGPISDREIMAKQLELNSVLSKACAEQRGVITRQEEELAELSAYIRKVQTDFVYNAELAEGLRRQCVDWREEGRVEAARRQIAELALEESSAQYRAAIYEAETKERLAMLQAAAVGRNAIAEQEKARLLTEIMVLQEEVTEGRREATSSAKAAALAARMGAEERGRWEGRADEVHRDMESRLAQVTEAFEAEIRSLQAELRRSKSSYDGLVVSTTEAANQSRVREAGLREAVAAMEHERGIQKTHLLELSSMCEAQEKQIQRMNERATADIASVNEERDRVLEGSRRLQSDVKGMRDFIRWVMSTTTTTTAIPTTSMMSSAVDNNNNSNSHSDNQMSLSLLLFATATERKTALWMAAVTEAISSSTLHQQRVAHQADEEEALRHRRDAGRRQWLEERVSTLEAAVDIERHKADTAAEDLAKHIGTISHLEQRCETLSTELNERVMRVTTREAETSSLGQTQTEQEQQLTAVRREVELLEGRLLRRERESRDALRRHQEEMSDAHRRLQAVAKDRDHLVQRLRLLQPGSSGGGGIPGTTASGSTGDPSHSLLSYGGGGGGIVGTNTNRSMMTMSSPHNHDHHHGGDHDDDVDSHNNNNGVFTAMTREDLLHAVRNLKLELGNTTRELHRVSRQKSLLQASVTEITSQLQLSQQQQVQVVETAEQPEQHKQQQSQNNNNTNVSTLTADNNNNNTAERLELETQLRRLTNDVAFATRERDLVVAEAKEEKEGLLTEIAQLRSELECAKGRAEALSQAREGELKAAASQRQALLAEVEEERCKMLRLSERLMLLRGFNSNQNSSHNNPNKSADTNTNSGGGGGGGGATSELSTAGAAATAVDTSSSSGKHNNTTTTSVVAAAAPSSPTVSGGGTGTGTGTVGKLSAMIDESRVVELERLWTQHSELRRLYDASAVEKGRMRVALDRCETDVAALKKEREDLLGVNTRLVAQLRSAFGSGTAAATATTTASSSSFVANGGGWNQDQQQHQQQHPHKLVQGGNYNNRHNKENNNDVADPVVVTTAAHQGAVPASPPSVVVHHQHQQHQQGQGHGVPKPRPLHMQATSSSSSSSHNHHRNSTTTRGDGGMSGVTNKRKSSSAAATVNPSAGAVIRRGSHSVRNYNFQ